MRELHEGPLVKAVMSRSGEPEGRERFLKRQFCWLKQIGLSSTRKSIAKRISQDL